MATTKKAAARPLAARPKPSAAVKDDALERLGVEEISAATIQPYHRWLIYAEPGTGKTSVIATSPRCFIIDADHNSDVVVARGLKAHRKLVSDWQDMDDILEYFRAGGTSKFDWVWLDTITLFQDRGLSSIMEDLASNRANRLRWAPDKGEYGQNMNRLMDWIRDMSKLPINFGITAHVMRYTSPTTEEELLVPMVTQKNMPDKVCGYMTLVGLLTKRSIGDGQQSELALHTVKTASYYAKEPWGAIGTMKDPTIPKMLARIDAKIAAAKARSTTATPTKTPVKKAAAAAKKG